MPFQKGNTHWIKGLDKRYIKTRKELAEMARRGGGKAIKTLIEACDDDDPRVRISAAQILLDRGYGKATHLNVEQQETLAQAHLEALKAVTAGARATLLTAQEQEQKASELRRVSEIGRQAGTLDTDNLNDINDLEVTEVEVQVNNELTRSSEESDEEER